MSLNWILMPAKIKSTMQKLSKILQSMQKSQNEDIYQSFTTWSLGRAIQKKRISENKPQQCSTLGSSLAYFIKTSLTSQQQSFHQLTPLHQWPGQLSDTPSLPNKKKVNWQRLMALGNALKRPEFSVLSSFWLSHNDQTKKPSLSCDFYHPQFFFGFSF